MNQANSQPLNYANPLDAPGVEVLSDGTDGKFHCRINPTRISYSQSKILIGVGAIHIGGLLLVILFIKFRSIGSVLTGPAGLTLLLAGLISLGYGLFTILYYAASTQPKPFECIADERQLIVGYSEQRLSPIPASAIRDLWIKRFLKSIENDQWTLNLLTRDNRVVTYRFHAPKSAELSAHETILRKILGVTETSNRNLILTLKYFEITAENAHEHPFQDPSKTPEQPIDTTGWKTGLEILSDSPGKAFHCRVVPIRKPGFFWKYAFNILLILAGLSITLFPTFTHARIPTNILLLSSVGGFLVVVFAAGSILIKRNKKEVDVFEFIVDPTQITLVAVGVCRESIPRTQFRELAFRPKLFRPGFNRTWILHLVWNDDLTFELRFKVPRNSDFKPLAEKIRKILDIRGDYQISPMARADYRLVPGSSGFERTRVNTN